MTYPLVGVGTGPHQRPAVTFVDSSGTAIEPINANLLAFGANYIQVPNTAVACYIDCPLSHRGGTLGFYGTVPIAKPTGVAVTAAGVHAALVALGLIGA